MDLCFVSDGWEHYVYWLILRLRWSFAYGKTPKRLAQQVVLDDIERNGEDKGTGKPEPLTGDWSGWWSRRIDEQNRLIYRIADDRLEIAVCRGHYGDK